MSSIQALPTNVPRPQLPALTSLRFFAALWVVLYHLRELRVFSLPGLYSSFAGIGYVGVSFFFVLSGFILVYTYAGRECTPARFWRARFARIYPAYAFSLLATIPILSGTLSNHSNVVLSAHPIGGMLLVLVLLQAWVPPLAMVWNGVAWSLSDEAFFYLGFPWLLKGLARLGRERLIMLAFGCWAASLLVTSTYISVAPDGAAMLSGGGYAFWRYMVQFNPLLRAPEFILGAACGYCFLKFPPDKKWASALVLGGLALIAVPVLLPGTILYPMLHSGFLAPGFAAVVMGLALAPRWAALLDGRALVLLGEASYSLYLLHLPLMVYLFYLVRGAVFQPQSWASSVLYLAIALGISTGVFWFVERPGRKLLRPRPQTAPGGLPEAAVAVAGEG